ncbi:MAG: hypothetical protein OXH53_14450 [bacterium]|nr:hypothetical protein [bacterium]
MIALCVLVLFTTACSQNQDAPPPDPAVHSLIYLSDTVLAEGLDHRSAADLASHSKAAADALSDVKPTKVQDIQHLFHQMSQILHEPGWPEAAHTLAHDLEIDTNEITMTQKRHIGNSAIRLANALRARNNE